MFLDGVDYRTSLGDLAGAGKPGELLGRMDLEVKVATE